MSTGRFRIGLSNEFDSAFVTSFREGKTTLHVVARTVVILLVVGLLAFVADAPNDEPTTASAPQSEPSTVDADGSEPATTKRQNAVCILRPVGASGVSGALHLVERGGKIEIRGEIRGLTPGKHGFHIHEFGDLSDSEKGKSAGGHFNPTNQPHGDRVDEHRHVGDLGNIEAAKDGKAIVEIRDSAIKFSGGHSVIGRSIVIHAAADKFTQPAGDAGARVAIGVIGIASSD